MSEVTLNDFLEENTGIIWRELKKPLPDKNDPVSIQQLRQMAAYADSVAMDVAVWVRRLGAHMDKLSLELSDEYEAKCVKNKEKISSTGREAFIKLRLSTERRWKKELEDLQEILKSRVMLAQSFLKSTGSEDRTTAVNKGMELR